MALYELGLVLSNEPNEEERDAYLGEIRELIAGEKGEIVNEDVWGKRTLAYEIKHQRDGFYLFWQIEAPGTFAKPLEYKLRLSDIVLRYLVINLDREMKRARKMNKLKAERKAKKAAKQRERGVAAEQAEAAAEGA